MILVVNQEVGNSALENELGKIFADVNNEIANIINSSEVQKVQMNTVLTTNSIDIMLFSHEFSFDFAQGCRAAASADRLNELLESEAQISVYVNTKETRDANPPPLPKSVTEYLQGSGGRPGNSATRAQNVQISEYLQSNGYTITNGAGFEKEEYLPGPGGTKGANYVDITATKNGQTIRINTVDVDSKGNITQRELNAANSINQKTGGNIILIPKGSGLGNLTNIIK